MLAHAAWFLIACNMPIAVFHLGLFGDSSWKCSLVQGTGNDWGPGKCKCLYLMWKAFHGWAGSPHARCTRLLIRLGVFRSDSRLLELRDSMHRVSGITRYGGWSRSVKYQISLRVCCLRACFLEHTTTRLLYFFCSSCCFSPRPSMPLSLRRGLWNL